MGDHKAGHTRLGAMLEAGAAAVMELGAAAGGLGAWQYVWGRLGTFLLLGAGGSTVSLHTLTPGQLVQHLVR